VTDSHDWALILAGGRGRRMQHLTRTVSGVPVPKQFCSLGRGPSLFYLALLRALRVAPPERILVTLTEAHQAWCKDLFAHLPHRNVLAQPEQRGTGIGILQPLLEILERDPDAALVILPSDHYFLDEATINTGLRKALRLTRTSQEPVILLGFEPDEPDTDLGYIVPGHARSEELFAVRRFTEKPAADRVRTLLKHGALWNSFIVAANAAALLAMFERRVPAVVAQVRDYMARQRSRPASSAQLAEQFAAIPTLDFSEHIIAPAPHDFGVLRLAPCGWSDLGTPARLARVVQRHRADIERAPHAPAAMRGQLDLAERIESRGSAWDSSASSLRSYP
jgi:mannose-1-phosphate guanylyltransferase